jgi:hypothetical protein
MYEKTCTPPALITIPDWVTFAGEQPVIISPLAFKGKIVIDTVFDDASPFCNVTGSVTLLFPSNLKALGRIDTAVCGPTSVGEAELKSVEDEFIDHAKVNVTRVNIIAESIIKSLFRPNVTPRLISRTSN